MSAQICNSLALRAKSGIYKTLLALLESSSPSAPAGAYAESLVLPFALLFLMILLPPRVLIRVRKP
jgi:hypothetical protein